MNVPITHSSRPLAGQTSAIYATDENSPIKNNIDRKIFNTLFSFINSTGIDATWELCGKEWQRRENQKGSAYPQQSISFDEPAIESWLATLDTIDLLKIVNIVHVLRGKKQEILRPFRPLENRQQEVIVSPPFGFVDDPQSYQVIAKAGELHLHASGDEPKLLMTRRLFLSDCKGDLAGLQLDHLDLGGVNFSGANLTGTKLDSTNLCGANLSDADMDGADLVKANLSNANLQRARLRCAKLIQTDLYGADLTQAILNEANATGADLRHTTLNWASLINTTLRLANLTGSELKGAELCSALLFRAKLIRTDLSWADLSNADLEEADFSCANFEGAILAGVKLVRAIFTGAINLHNATITLHLPLRWHQEELTYFLNHLARSLTKSRGSIITAIASMDKLSDHHKIRLLHQIIDSLTGIDTSVIHDSLFAILRTHNAVFQDSKIQLFIEEKIRMQKMAILNGTGAAWRREPEIKNS